MNSQEDRLEAKEVFAIYLSMAVLFVTFLSVFVFLI